MKTVSIRPVHPGEVLQDDFLVPLNLSATALARALRVPVTHIHDIINERRALSANMAIRLARFVSTSGELWMNLQVSHDLQKARIESGECIARDVRPLKVA